VVNVRKPQMLAANYSDACNIFVAVSSRALPNNRARRSSGSLSAILKMANSLGGAVSLVLAPVIAARYAGHALWFDPKGASSRYE